MRIAVLDDYQGYCRTRADWIGQADFEVVPFTDHVADEKELVARLTGFDAVMRIRERTPMPRRVLSRLPGLRLILATGMRNAGSLDLVAADELGITVSTTEALHQSTVDVVFALLLALFRRIPEEAAALRAGGWQTQLGRGLAGKTLGIVGLGNMGRPVAQIAALFGMRVVAWSPNLTPERAAPLGVACVGKHSLFAEVDAVTVHMPLVPATRNVVDRAAIAAMRPDAILINTARAELVDQDALLDALRSRRIGGAGLDVFDVEPLPMDHPYRWLPNVVASPHIGFATVENYERFFTESLENLRAFLAGRPIRVITGAQPFLPDSQVALQGRI